MDSYFFFHGKPLSGESTSRNVLDGFEDRIYEEFFHANFHDKAFMLYELRQWKNSLYSVYSYYRDGFDHSKRPNGYVVLTLVVKNKYSIKPSNIYRLMEDVYKRGLQQALKLIDGNGIYLVSTFADKREPLGILEEDVYRLLNIDDFRELKSIPKTGDTPDDNSVIRVNPADADSEAYMDVLLGQGKMYISADYPSNKEKIHTLERMYEELKSAEKKQSNLENENRLLKNEVATLNKQLKDEGIENQRETINKLMLENERLKENINNLKKNVTNTEFDSISTQVSSLAKKMSENIKPSNIHLSVNTLLLLVCLLGIFKPFSHFASERQDTTQLNNQDTTQLNKMFTEAKFKKIPSIKTGNEIFLDTIINLPKEFDTSKLKWSVEGGDTIGVFAEIRKNNKLNKLKAHRKGEIIITCEYNNIKIKDTLKIEDK